MKKKELDEMAERQAQEAEERSIREAEEREKEMELLRTQMARDRDEESRITEAARNKELQDQLKVLFFEIIHAHTTMFKLSFFSGIIVNRSVQR